MSSQLSSLLFGVFPSGQHPYRVPSHPPSTGGRPTHASMQVCRSGNSMSTEVSLSTHDRRAHCPLEELKYKRALVPWSRETPVPLHGASLGSHAHLGSLEATDRKGENGTANRSHHMPRMNTCRIGWQGKCGPLQDSYCRSLYFGLDRGLVRV